MRVVRKFLILSLSLLALSVSVTNAMDITKGKRASASIYIPHGASNAEINAAKKLQYNIALATGVQLEILMTQPKGKGGKIYIKRYTGGDAIEGSYQVKSLDDSSVEIIGVGRGILYGVYDFLESLGFRAVGGGDMQVPFLISGAKAQLPINSSWRPTVAYNNIYSLAANHEDFASWNKLNFDHNSARSNWGLWGASYFELLSPSEYFANHPEYFSLVDGVRTPEQLCLSNLGVLQIVTENMEKIFAKNPSARYFSVSPQPNRNFCQCEECTAMDEVDGSSIGSVVQFADIIAQTFSDKKIGLFVDVNTMSAPTTTMTSENLVIVLSNSYGDFSKPVAIDDSHSTMRSELEAWTSASNSVMIWDYIASPYTAALPFMNIGAMGDNLKYYFDMGIRSFCFDATMQKDVYMGEVKAYILSRLMANPALSTDDILQDYCKHNYGSAAPFVLEFFVALEGKFNEARGSAYLYGSVDDARSSWLSDSAVSELNAMIQTAMNVVRVDPKLYDRVERLTIKL